MKAGSRTTFTETSEISSFRRWPADGASGGFRSTNEAIGGDVECHDRVSADRDPVSDGDATYDHSVGPNEDVIADGRRTASAVTQGHSLHDPRAVADDDEGSNHDAKRVEELETRSHDRRGRQVGSREELVQGLDQDRNVRLKALCEPEEDDGLEALEYERASSEGEPR